MTIMFCDIVGSSALSMRLDPEEQRDVVSAFQSCCAGEIKRFGGMVDGRLPRVVALIAKIVSPLEVAAVRGVGRR